MLIEIVLVLEDIKKTLSKKHTDFRQGPKKNFQIGDPFFCFLLFILEFSADAVI